MNGLTHEYSETCIRTAMGIEPKRMRELRKCLETGLEKRSGAFWYTKEAVIELLALLGLDDSVKTEELLKKCRHEDAPEETGETVAELTVAKHWPNRRILGCTLNGEMQRVRVKDSNRFRIGMKINCVNINKDLWELASAPRIRR